MHFNSPLLTFPLPRLIEPGVEPGRGRRSLAASRRATAVTRATNEVLEALDFLNGEEERSDVVIHRPLVAPSDAPEPIRALYDTVCATDFEPVGEEAALKSLLRGRGGDYESSDPTQGSLASFSLHALSLPETTASAPLVRDLRTGDATAQQQVEEPQRLLRDIDEYELMVKENGGIKPYVDPILQSSCSHYISFCRRMYSAGLCRPILTAKR